MDREHYVDVELRLPNELVTELRSFAVYAGIEVDDLIKVILALHVKNIGEI
jgi:hypothetical protein